MTPTSPLSKLLATLSAVISCTPDELSALSNMLTIKHFSPKQFIFDAGEMFSNIYFINTGLCRAVISQGKEEKTVHLAGENDFVTNIDGLIQKNPSHYALQALTHMETVCINDEALEWVLHNVKQGRKLFRIIYGQYCYLQARIVLSNIKPNPMQRYGELLVKFSDIEQLVSQRIIASYLNITPEYLSMLKGQRIQPALTS